MGFKPFAGDPAEKKEDYMKFTPMNETKIAATPENKPWPKGDYDFTVEDAEETTSKAGNEMLKLTLRVFNDAGKERKVFDYLVSAMEYKLHHFAQSLGLEDQYRAGELAADLVYKKSGKLKLGIKPDGEWNEVKDYVPMVAGSSQTDSPKVNDLDDDLPF